MEKTIIFPSRRAPWFTLSVLLPLGIMMYMFLQQPWYQAFILLPVQVIILPVYFRTYYRLHPVDGLTVTCGLFYRKTFDPGQLRSVKYTGNPVSSPALSLRRLELRFKNSESVIISPVNREDFIRELRRYNQDFEVKK